MLHMQGLCRRVFSQNPKSHVSNHFIETHIENMKKKNKLEPCLGEKVRE